MVLYTPHRPPALTVQHATTPSDKPGSLFMVTRLHCDSVLTRIQELIRATDEHGRPRMYVVRSGQPCAECMRTKEPWLCRHSLDESPHWSGFFSFEILRRSESLSTGRTAPRRSVCGTSTSALNRCMQGSSSELLLTMACGRSCRATLRRSRRGHQCGTINSQSVCFCLSTRLLVASASLRS